MMAKLPGLGPRSAQRVVLQLIKKPAVLMHPLVETLSRVAYNVRECLVCGNISTAETCDICSDVRRQTTEICIVETVADLWAMERAAVFKGVYHVLGGTLSALEGVGPNDLRIPQLLHRIREENTQEVILALSATVDGQTTAHYIADQIPERSVTFLAQGVPMGGELDYLDDGTISAAFKARKPI